MATDVQGNVRIIFLKLKKKKKRKKKNTDKANSMQNSKISLCLTAIRSLRASCEESLPDEHEVSTSYFFFFFVDHLHP